MSSASPEVAIRPGPSLEVAMAAVIIRIGEGGSESVVLGGAPLGPQCSVTVVTLRRRLDQV